MMNLLRCLDPGDAMTRAILGALVQSSVVIFLGALLARAAFSRRADARHTLWLGVLVWVLLSPIAAEIADRSGRALILVPLPFPNPRAPAPIAETTSDAEVFDNLESGDGATRVDSRPPERRSAEDSIAAERMKAKAAIALAVAPLVEKRGDAIVGGLTLLWAVGLLVQVIRIAAGWRQLTALSRIARQVDAVRHGSTLERAVFSTTTPLKIVSGAGAFRVTSQTISDSSMTRTPFQRK